MAKTPFCPFQKLSLPFYFLSTRQQQQLNKEEMWVREREWKNMTENPFGFEEGGKKEER